MRRALVALTVLVPAFVTAQAPASDAAPATEKNRTELLQRLSNRAECGDACMWEVADALGKVENRDFLFAQFQTTKNADERLGIEYALYRIDDPEVAAFFKQLVTDAYDDGELLYYPLNYLAKRCDADALRVLSGDGKGSYKGYPGCLQWSKTVELFGECNYRPAVPYLINSIQAACMNIGIAAVEDLRKMYPGSPDFEDYSLGEIEQYFRERAATGSER